jgi:hypothetical protein
VVIDQFKDIKKNLSSKFHLEGKNLSFEIDFIDGLNLSFIDLQFFGSSWMVSFI